MDEQKQIQQNFEISTFTGRVRQVGHSLGIMIDSVVVDYEEINKGDFVKVMIKKLPKKETERWLKGEIDDSKTITEQ